MNQFFLCFSTISIDILATQQQIGRFSMLKIILNDLHILPLPGNKTRFRQSDPIFKEATTCLFATLITQNNNNNNNIIIIIIIIITIIIIIISQILPLI